MQKNRESIRFASPTLLSKIGFAERVIQNGPRLLWAYKEAVIIEVLRDETVWGTFSKNFPGHDRFQFGIVSYIN